MKHYLTNIDKTTDAEFIKLIPEAAKRSGQDVRYEDNPMPNHVGKAYAANFGCVVGFEILRDYSRFWSEMRKLQGKPIKGLDD